MTVSDLNMDNLIRSNELLRVQRKLENCVKKTWNTHISRAQRLRSVFQISEVLSWMLYSAVSSCRIRALAISLPLSFTLADFNLGTGSLFFKLLFTAGIQTYTVCMTSRVITQKYCPKCLNKCPFDVTVAGLLAIGLEPIYYRSFIGTLKLHVLTDFSIQ